MIMILKKHLYYSKVMYFKININMLNKPWTRLLYFRPRKVWDARERTTTCTEAKEFRVHFVYRSHSPHVHNYVIHEPHVPIKEEQRSDCV